MDKVEVVHGGLHDELDVAGGSGGGAADPDKEGEEGVEDVDRVAFEVMLCEILNFLRL